MHNKYMDSNNGDTGSEIVFFDLETTLPSGPDGRRDLLEFGAIVLSPHTLVELDVYSTLVRPGTSFDYDRRSGITRDAVASAPTFREIADRVYHILNGRIWAGHNIEGFDCLRIQEAFEEIGRQAPEPIRRIDSLRLLNGTFRRRAKKMELATLANYFELGRQKHRSLADARMTLEVIKCCATVLYLEKPDHFDESSINDQMDVQEANMEGSTSFANFLDPDYVSIPAVSVSHRRDKIQVLHRDVPLELYCKNLTVYLDISTKYDSVTFVVRPTPSLRHVLDVCDDRVLQTLSKRYDRSISLNPVVYRSSDHGPNFATIRVHILVEGVGDISTCETEMYEKDASGNPQRLEFIRFDRRELNRKIVKGKLIDAYLSLEGYDYDGRAGIRLMAKRLIFD